MSEFKSDRDRLDEAWYRQHGPDWPGGCDLPATGATMSEFKCPLPDLPAMPYEFMLKQEELARKGLIQTHVRVEWIIANAAGVPIHVDYRTSFISRSDNGTAALELYQADSAAARIAALEHVLHELVYERGGRWFTGIRGDSDVTDLIDSIRR